MEPLNDDELRHVLREWSAPAAPAYLEHRIFGARPWRRWFLTGSIRVPVPVFLLAIVMLSAWLYVAPRKPQPQAVSANEVRFSDFQPLPELKPRIIRGNL